MTTSSIQASESNTTILSNATQLNSLNAVYSKGIELFSQKLHSEAQQVFDELLKTIPADTKDPNLLFYKQQSYYFIGNIFSQKNKFREAINNYSSGYDISRVTGKGEENFTFGLGTTFLKWALYCVLIASQLEIQQKAFSYPKIITFVDKWKTGSDLIPELDKFIDEIDGSNEITNKEQLLKLINMASSNLEMAKNQYLLTLSSLIKADPGKANMQKLFLLTKKQVEKIELSLSIPDASLSKYQKSISEYKQK